MRYSAAALAELRQLDPSFSNGPPSVPQDRLAIGFPAHGGVGIPPAGQLPLASLVRKMHSIERGQVT